MKTFQTVFLVLLALTVFFGVKDITVEGVLESFVSKGWGTLALWLGDGQPLPSANSRQLPQGQGDDSEVIIPIENLEDAE